jgi:hypothetical protein
MELCQMHRLQWLLMKSKYNRMYCNVTADARDMFQRSLPGSPHLSISFAGAVLFRVTVFIPLQLAYSVLANRQRQQQQTVTQAIDARKLVTSSAGHLLR